MGPDPPPSGVRLDDNEAEGEEPAGTPPRDGLGPALRRAWLGYQMRLDEAIAEAGFGERRFPDGRVLRLCADPTGATISRIGRELDITRQGAAKVVGRLGDRGFVTVADSPTSKREKCVTLTSRGVDYLRVQRTTARRIEEEVKAALGEEGFSSLLQLLHALDPGASVRLRTYLQRSAGGDAETNPSPSPVGAHRPVGGSA